MSPHRAAWQKGLHKGMKGDGGTCVLRGRVGGQAQWSSAGCWCFATVVVGWSWCCASCLHSFRLPLERGHHTHFCVPQASSVGEYFQHPLAISPAPTSRGCIPTRQSACGSSWWPRAPLSCSPSATSSWSTTTPAPTTTCRSTTGLPGTGATSWAPSVATAPRHPSPPPGTSWPWSSAPTGTWPSTASPLPTRKVAGRHGGH